MKEKILNKLKEDTSRYMSGEVLSEMFGVTRTAIWKNIKELKEEGYGIESSSRKGYRLIFANDILNKYEIAQGLATNLLGRDIHYFDVLDSTNSYAKEVAMEGCKEGTVVVADRQTKGRGRMGRDWASPAGKGIWMSVVLKPDICPEDIQVITLGASVAVVNALKDTAGVQAGIKWPNDIILGKKKVCGILTEMSLEVERINFLVLGMGINVSHCIEDFPEDLRDKATSLRIFLNSTVEQPEISVEIPERSKLIRNILTELEKIYNVISEGNTEYVINQWEKYSLTLGNEVLVTARNNKYAGVARQVTKEGKLIVDCEDGITREILSGEVSVRGILGYV